jgi:pimeloyl-ACP methyl ester carboxylesterase
MNLLIAIALLFASLAILTHLGALRAEQRHPPAGAFVALDGVRLHYTDAGSGPAVVLVHGASTSLLDFQASIAGGLSEDHRVIAVDRPGHGYSERPPGGWPDPAQQARLIRVLVRELGVERPIIVGHSWSGSVVLAYLLDYPDETAGGVLLAGGSRPWEGGVAWYNDVATVPVLGQLFAHTVVYPFGRLSLESAVRNVFAPNPVAEGYTERTGVRLSLRPDSFLANAQDLRRLSDFLAVQSTRYGEIRHPVLAVTGGADHIVPSWNHAARLLRQIPHLEHIELEDTGHALHHAHPERVAGLIASFARRLAARDGHGTAMATPRKQVSLADDVNREK